MKTMLTDYSQCPDAELLPLADASCEAMRELILRYTRLVRACARPLFLVGGDQEDLVQEGMIGLVDAIRSYSPSGGASFQSFAALCIRRRMISAVRAASAQKHAPLNDSISMEEARLQTEPSLGAGPETEFIGREGMREFMAALRGALTSVEREVLELYLAGCSYREISRRIDKPVKSVDNAVQRIRRKAAAISGESGFPV